MTPLILLVLLGCGDEDLSTALQPLPAEAGLASCLDLPFPELETVCRVEVAARAAGREDLDLVDAACDGIEDQVWRDECNFRAGEELARKHAWAASLPHCEAAGSFAEFCLTHVTWHPPPLPNEPAGALAGLEQVLAQVEGAAVSAEFGQRARRAIGTRYWFDLYLGSGSADPARARSAPDEWAPEARAAFALEAVRLLSAGGVPVDLADRVRDVWLGQEPPPTGAPLDPRERHGRYHPPIPTAADRLHPVAHTYAGGTRLVAPVPEDDLVVCVLEALYFQPSTDGIVFLPFLDHDSSAVRRTAARLVRVTPSDEVDNAQVLRGLVDSDDPGVAEHARQGLRHREWTRFVGTADGRAPIR